MWRKNRGLTASILLLFLCYSSFLETHITCTITHAFSIRRSEYRRAVRTFSFRRIILEAASSTSSSSSLEDPTAATTTDNNNNNHPSQRRPSLHPLTIDGIAKGLQVRAQHDPNLPLREVEGRVEPWEVMLSAGKIAQAHLEEKVAAKATMSNSKSSSSSYTHDELQAMGGRMAASVMRFDYLEAVLHEQCQQQYDMGNDNDNHEWCYKLGWLPPTTRTSSGEDDDEQQQQQQHAVDARVLEDSTFGRHRATSLLAIFLQTIEGPGLAFSGESIPGGSEIDFLSDDQKRILLVLLDDDDDDDDNAIMTDLHPLTILGVINALQLRAQNKKFSLLRERDDVENCEMQIMMTAGRLAEQTIQRHHQQQQQQQVALTPRDEELVGSRIVAVALRLSELEELLHERYTSSTSMAGGRPSSFLMEALGLLDVENEQNPCKIDDRIKEDEEFTRRRAESLLALFLEHYEKPTLEARTSIAADGSTAAMPDKNPCEINFLDDHRRFILLNETTTKLEE